MSFNREKFLRDWVEALRSGKYEQGRGLLRNNHDEFCCLGVACDVAGVDWVDPQDNGYYEAHTVGEIASSAYLPYDLAESLNVNEVTLTQMNDGERKTFAEIADYIEETYLS